MILNLKFKNSHIENSEIETFVYSTKLCSIRESNIKHFRQPEKKYSRQFLCEVFFNSKQIV